MATQAQINANRLNSRKSTGPITSEGKAKSCMNRLSHGFAGANICIPIEDQEHFDALLTDLVNQFLPATPNEQILVEKMVQNHWLTLRAVRLQTIALNATVSKGYIHKDLGILIRYQNSSDRAYHKAHAELVKAQKERGKSRIGFESENVPEFAEAPAEALARAAETPQKPPEALQKSATVASQAPVELDFTSVEDEIEAVMNISIEELKRAA
jgi:hypothetical protein